ncbi:MAG: hypothetical protein OXQ28_11720 [Acidobacteriota bacterium]|nr:hypothetical protein [Acidobacteriota bacterium]
MSNEDRNTAESLDDATLKGIVGGTGNPDPPPTDPNSPPGGDPDGLSGGDGGPAGD